MTAAWLAAILCVGVMGFAIQRGATCTVAAVDEVLTKRRAHRLAAMLEASLWVAGGLTLARLADLAGSMPIGYSVSTWTLVGGALLGLGAWINRACVFGASARLGSGEAPAGLNRTTYPGEHGPAGLSLLGDGPVFV